MVVMPQSVEIIFMEIEAEMQVTLELLMVSTQMMLVHFLLVTIR